MKTVGRIMYFGLASVMLFSFSTSAAFAAKKKVPNFVKFCKKECPDATDTNSAHECIEKLEHADNNEAFKKSKCYVKHEKWEAATGKEEAEEHEKKESMEKSESKSIEQK